MIGKLREIINELLDQIAGRRIIFRFVSPGFARIEDGAVDAGDRYGEFETEIRILLEFRIVQASIKRSVQQSARCFDGHTVDAGHRRFAAGPAGVDQPALHGALGNPLFQEITIDAAGDAA